MRKALLIPMLLLLAAPLTAQVYQDLYVVPVVARVIGANNTTFVSDVAIQNFQSTPLTVTFLFIESGLSDAENVDVLVTNMLPNGQVTVPAGGTIILSDIVNGFEGRNTGLIGSLIVSGDRPFAMTSRAYGSNATGTFGQSVLPVTGFAENAIGNTDNNTAVAYVPGLIFNGIFRSNLGFVASTATNPMRVEVTIRSATGMVLGTRGYDIPAQRFVHLQFPTTDVTSAVFAAASAEFRIVSGDGAVAAYGSVVDGRNSDAIYIPGTFPNNTPFSLRSPVMDRLRWLTLVTR